MVVGVDQNKLIRKKRCKRGCPSGSSLDNGNLITKDNRILTTPVILPLPLF